MEHLGAAAVVPAVAFMALGNAIQAGRAAAAQERAIDAGQAAAISGSTARAFQRSAANWQAEAVLADAEIRRLRGQVDDLVLERSDLIAHLGDLLAENERLRAWARRAA